MFSIKNRIAISGLLLISLILFGCKEDDQNNKESKALLQSQQLLEKARQSSEEVSKPANYQYNSKPAEARVPYPPIPDQPITPSKENQ